jgi:two-component system NtrC family sensor kinase
MPKSDLILLALEEGQNLQLFERALAAASYEVAIAHDRPGLDKALQESSPALVVLSRNFQTADGLEIAAALLERFPTLPILLFLPHTSSEAIKRAMHIGISDCLYPPLHIDDIMHTVENSLSRAKHLGDWTRREVKRTTASLEKRVGELQKLDTIFNNIEDGVIILDENLSILLINPAVRRAFGIWNDEAVLGKPILDAIPNSDLRTLLRGDSKDSLLHNEITFDDGRVLSAQYTPIPGVGSAVTLLDITHLKQIDRLKSEFVHTVSHDLRSPLTAILGYVELLERVGPINDQQREFIKRVHNSVQSITSLINDLLDLGRLEAGIDSQREMIPLEGMLRYTLETLGLQINEKKQKVHLKLPDEDLPQIPGNPIRLSQMLDNLIGNAVKYTPEGGEIRIKVELHGDQVILHVSDTGPGIPPADQAHVFEKFYRGSNVPEGVGGSGLGLAIVKSIVDNHQGRIWVESVLGQGSTFTVVLPLYRQEAPQPA